MSVLHRTPLQPIPEHSESKQSSKQNVSIVTKTSEPAPSKQNASIVTGKSNKSTFAAINALPQAILDDGPKLAQKMVQLGYLSDPFNVLAGPSSSQQLKCCIYPHTRPTRPGKFDCR